MKTFKDLKFKRHPVGDGLMARMKFRNGYGISVIRCSYNGRPVSYTSGDDDWEVAILKDNDICYKTPFSDDVLGHQSKEDVTDVMRKIQELK